uniref:Uncharacterized protein n=1 Tax=Cynoglossus semilaevis TaxID=244447 RepID=A0A3P8UHW3_CYNSE
MCVCVCVFGQRAFLRGRNQGRCSLGSVGRSPRLWHLLTEREMTHSLCLPHGTKQFPDAVVLSSQQAEHLTDELRVLDVALLGPADHGLGDQFLQIGWRHRYIHDSGTI